VAESTIPTAANTMQVSSHNMVSKCDIANPDVGATYYIVVIPLSDQCSYSMIVEGMITESEAIPLQSDVTV
jgi:hypothetical protein